MNTNYVLTIYWRDGKIQVKNYNSLLVAVAAALKLSSRLCKGYSISLVLHTCTF